MRSRMAPVRVIVATFAFVAFGCTAEPTVTSSSAGAEATEAPPSEPSASPDRQRLCQPFPDRLFDGVLEAYGDGDLPASRS